jgi:hypothetical protein
MFNWQMHREKVLQGAKISPKNKLEGFRLLNELADRVLTKQQKIRRQKLREN